MTALLRLVARWLWLSRHFAHSCEAERLHHWLPDPRRAGWCGWTWRAGWATISNDECLEFAGPCWWLTRPGAPPQLVPLTRDASVWDRGVN